MYTCVLLDSVFKKDRKMKKKMKKFLKQMAPIRWNGPYNNNNNLLLLLLLLLLIG